MGWETTGFELFLKFAIQKVRGNSLPDSKNPRGIKGCKIDTVTLDITNEHRIKSI